MVERCDRVVVSLVCVVVGLAWWLPASPLPGQEGGRAGETSPSAGRIRPPVRVVWSHILVTHVEGRRIPGISRSRAEARRRADEALAMARLPGVKFEDAVAKFSDEPFAGARRGRVGPPVTRGQFRGPYKVIGDTLFSMSVGQVSDVVESPAGFHIIKRLPIRQYAASEILIQFEGSARADASVTRTKEEAAALAEALLAKVRQEGADFAAVARSESDGPSSAQGGFLGHFETGQIALELESALDEMQVGEVRGVIETPVGFHILRRETFDPAKFHRITVSHILIRYAGAKEVRYPDRTRQPKTEVTRTKDEALQLAGKVLSESRAAGADFGSLAVAYSDGPEREAGGELGAIGWGDTGMDAFEKAAFALQVGEIAGPVETPFGFHIILRTE